MSRFLYRLRLLPGVLRDFPLQIMLFINTVLHGLAVIAAFDGQMPFTVAKLDLRKFGDAVSVFVHFLLLFISVNVTYELRRIWEPRKSQKALGLRNFTLFSEVLFALMAMLVIVVQFEASRRQMVQNSAPSLAELPLLGALQCPMENNLSSNSMPTPFTFLTNAKRRLFTVEMVMGCRTLALACLNDMLYNLRRAPAIFERFA